MRWLAAVRTYIHRLLQPAYDLNVAFAELKPGYYILVVQEGALPRAEIQKIGWPRVGQDPEVKLMKVVVRGNPKDVIALWRVPGAVEIVE